MSGVVIVGAGHGGVQLGASLRELGYDDSIRILSADPDLPYHKPPLSKSFMKTAETPLQPLRARSFYDQAAIRLDLGCEVTGLDRPSKRVLCADGTVIAYDRLVLATGARARALAVPGAELRGVHTLRTASDARSLRAALPQNGRVAVIGGGFIGLEAAAMLAARGIAVDVIELAPRLLGRAASAAMAGAVADHLAARGVALHLEQSVFAITGEDGQVSGVTLNAGALDVDLVLIGVGAEPVDDLARMSGLATENGIRVDRYLATEDPDIFSIGDCASFPQQQLGCRARLESVQNATDQARALARTLTGTQTAYSVVPWFWSDIGSLKLQIAGLAQGADNQLETGDGARKSVYHFKADRLVAAETLNSAGEHMLARRMIADGVTPARSVLATGDAAEIKKAYLQQLRTMA